MKMSSTYETEQKSLESRTTELKAIIEAVHDKHQNAENFLRMVRQYTEIQELDAEIIRTFIERINVFQTEKIDGRKQQRIQIIFRCIGEFQVPSKEKRHS